VSRGARAAVFGGIATIAYVAAVIVGARLDPFVARPILDGLTPVPLYRWVEPPPTFASTNKAPTSGLYVLTPAAGTYDVTTGVAAGVFHTGDYQANLALAGHAIGGLPGTGSVSLTLLPLAPGTDLSLPAGYVIAGNVVKIEATYRPTGHRVSKLARPSLLTLSYPLVVQGGFSDSILVSSDGRRWTALTSTDHPAQQIVLATIRSIGFFAVGQAPGTGAPVPPGPGRSVPRWVVVALVAMGSIALVLALVLRGRKRPRPPRRRPSRDERDPFDP
jgi:hypothetical protein